MLRTIILITVLAAAHGNKCVQQSFGSGLIVCVCNSTYCDTIEEAKLQAGQFLRYTSTKDGQRLQLTVDSFSSNNDENKSVLLVDRDKKYQMINGFGGAITDAVALNLRTLSNKTQQQLLNSYFGSKGIGYTHCRIPIAGTDFSTRGYTYDDTPNDFTLSNFSLVEEDDYKIHYLHQIKSIMTDPQSLRIFTTSWSAPAWMKTSGNIKWGSLKPEYNQIYADYIRKFFDAYKERGVDIWGMTPGNEPFDGLSFLFPFNAMFWGPKGEAYWSVNYLEPTLSKAGYKDIVYMAMDDQRFELPWYVDIMFRNKEANKIFSGIAHHWYTDIGFSPLRLTQTHNKHPDKFLLMTEACSGSFIWEKEKVILGSWTRGEDYMFDIIENLSHWVTGWIDWNIVLNKTGGPNWAHNFVDSPIIAIPEKDEFYKQPMFYAMSHFSKFVPRNSYRIFSEGPNDLNSNLQSIAFSTPENKTVIIIANKGENPIDITVRDKNLQKGTMKLKIPANSFNTLLYLEQQ